jgi:hypothetical protein
VHVSAWLYHGSIVCVCSSALLTVPAVYLLVRWNDALIFCVTVLSLLSLPCSRCAAKAHLTDTHLHSQFKWVASAEGFRVDAEELVTSLALCFCDRPADVYAREIVTPAHLRPTGTACEQFFAPLAADDELWALYTAMM